MDKLLRPAQVRQRLNISPNTLNKWVNLGVLPVAGRLPMGQGAPLGERRFALEDVIRLETEMKNGLK